MSSSRWIALLVVLMIAVMKIVSANVSETVDPATQQHILYFTPNKETQTPSSSSSSSSSLIATVSAVEGLVVLFHGCSHSGADWDTLPIERMIVSKILEAGYVAMALTSQDRRHRCWRENDLPRIGSAIRHFLSKGLIPAGKPIHLLGRFTQS